MVRTPPAIRRAEIVETIETKGFCSINQRELAKKYGVHESMIGKDMVHIKKHLKIEDLHQIKIKLGMLYAKSLQECERILFSNESKNKLEAARTFKQLSEGLIDFLERFGIKDVSTPISDTSITVVWGEKKDE